MDFTREPIIQSVITPKEGYKLVVRSSKNGSQEEYFVDAVEVVSFGNALFFRSLERPKSFFVPANDYEVLEVREAHMVLKHVGLDRSIKIGGGREGSIRNVREPSAEKEADEMLPQPAAAEALKEEEGAAAERLNGRFDKRRDRRRQYRRKKGKEDKLDAGQQETASEREILPEGSDVPEPAEPAAANNPEPQSSAGEVKAPARMPRKQKGEGSEERKKRDNARNVENGKVGEGATAVTPPLPFSTLLPPPPTLISETISRYKDNALFKGAFFTREEKEAKNVQDALEQQAAMQLDITPEEQQQIGEVLKSLTSFSPEEQDPFKQLLFDSSEESFKVEEVTPPEDVDVRDDLWNFEELPDLPDNRHNN